MGNLIEQQAIDFSNVPIIQRGVKASVHLEDWEDVLFWDTMIQRVSPGRYNYHPLLALLYCLRNKDSRLSRKDFATCLPHQCKAVELLDNGKGILSRISKDLARMMNSSGILSDIDFVAEEARYSAMGLTEDNAYLRVRGHNLYDLLKCMGHQLCSAQQVDFENQILNASVPSEGSYWEIDCSAGDLRHILI